MVLSSLLFAVNAYSGPYEDGVAALKSGHAEAARVSLREAVEAEPGRVEAWWELGWAYRSVGDHAGAVAAWEEVERLSPQWPELSGWLATARAQVELAGAPSTAREIPSRPSEGRIRFAAAGDTMMGSDLRHGVSGLAPGNGENLFEHVWDVFHSADVAFLNLEGPLADGLPSTKCGPKSTSCYAFRTPTRYAAALVNAQIDVVSLANNHALDLGVAGQDATMAALDAVGIAHAGRYGDVARLEVDGRVVAVVAAHSGSCCLNVNDIGEVTAAIALADQWADVVVLSFHGGAEGSAARHVPGRVEVAWGERRGDVMALAHAAVDAGADLVLGHGPHVLRAMQVYRGRLIAYSLGNFMGYRQFGTKGGHGGTTVILDAQLADNGVLVAARLHAVALDGESVPHFDPTGAGLRAVGSLSAADLKEGGVTVAEDGALSW